MKFRINQLDLNNVEVVKEIMSTLSCSRGHEFTCWEAEHRLIGLEAGIRAMVSVNESLELPLNIIVEALLKYFPTDFRAKGIPCHWLGLEKPFTMDFKDITSFVDLYDKLPDEQKLAEDGFREKLISTYLWELVRIQQEADRAQKPKTMLWPFREAGSQWIAEFEVKDLVKPVEDRFNFHFQNTSQWIYAGCILVQDGRVSTHH